MQASDEENAVSGRPDAAVGRGKKMYYSISEVCAMTGIGQHVLRYWEKEFSLLHPKKNSGGKRAYKEKDIEAIVKIKRMLEEEKYTLQGAKSKLLDERRGLRTNGAAAAKTRGKADASDGGEESDSADPPPEPAKRKPAAKKSGGGIGHDGVDGGGERGNGKALISSIRGELLEIQKILTLCSN